MLLDILADIAGGLFVDAVDHRLRLTLVGKLALIVLLAAAGAAVWWWLEPA